MVTTVVTSALLLVTGAPALTPPEQPATVAVAVNPVYPTDASGTLVPWKDLLSRDPELYELSSTCEDPGLDPMATNYNDAKITGYPSKGILQFQPGTFLRGVKQYNVMPGKTDQEILSSIYDPYLQMFVARHMIDDGQGRQWSCYNLLHLSSKYPLAITWKTATTSDLALKKLD